MSIVANTSNPVKENPVTFQCPVLTSTNYMTWAIKMEAIMDAQRLWEFIEPAAGVAADKKKSKLAHAFIFQAISEDILMQVAKKKTAHEVWESLKTRFVGADRVQKARLPTLKSEFEALRMKEGESIDEYARKLYGMISNYNSVGATLNDKELVRKLFNTVTEKYIKLIASMKQYSDVEETPFEEAIRRLKVYEDRHLVVVVEARMVIEAVEVAHDGVVGQAKVGVIDMARNRLKKKPEQEVHLMREMEEEALLLCVKWDHVPSMVMLNEDKVFPKLNEGRNSSNQDMCLGQLTEVGYDLHNEYLKVYNNQGTLVITVQRSSNKLYKMALNVTKLACLAASLVDDAWTWHARLGHANFYTLEMMGKKRMVTGMPCVAHPKQLCNGSKDEALAKFKIFKTQVETKTEYKVKVLRTGRRGEFNSHDFAKFCQGEKLFPGRIPNEAAIESYSLFDGLKLNEIDLDDDDE
nr:putative zinc finger, CCHC-type [Tanacetum cinerariifolium]